MKVYERDGITLYQGDCREILPTLGAVDHVITDPPYEAEAHTLARRIKTTGGGGDYGTVGVLALDFEPMSSEVRCAVGREMGRLANGWILVFCQVEATQLWAQSIEAKYMRTQIWVKIDGQPQLSGDRPGMGYESIVTAWGGEGRSRWNGGGRVGVYRYTTEKAGTGHLTEKPLPLMRELTELFTDPGETILDPFMGSGTTLVAAYQLGRKAIGIELEEKWCEVTIKRLEAQTPPLFTMPAEKPVQSGWADAEWMHSVGHGRLDE